MTWQQASSSGYANYSSGGSAIMARMFDLSGTAIEEQPIAVSPPSPGLQADPAAAMDEGWRPHRRLAGAGNLDGSGLGIFCAAIRCAGQPDRYDDPGEHHDRRRSTRPRRRGVRGGEVTLAWTDVGPDGLSQSTTGPIDARFYRPSTMVEDPQPLELNDVGAGVYSAAILSAGQVDTYEFEAPVTGRMTIQLGDLSGSNLVATLSALDSTGVDHDIR